MTINRKNKRSGRDNRSRYHDDDAPATGRVRIVLDIETGLADAAALETERAVCKPAGNIRDDGKKADNLAARQAAVEDSNGKLDSNPIRVIGVRYRGQYTAFTAAMLLTDADMTAMIDGGTGIVPAKTERGMLRKFFRWLDTVTRDADEVRLLAYNGNDFDFRRLRFRAAVQRVQLPAIMQPGSVAWYCDVMERFCRMTVNPQLKKYASLPTACLLLGVRYEKLIDGKEIPQAIADGRWREVILSNKADVRETHQIARAMKL